MENKEKLWTNKQTNSFFRKQLKGFLKPYGFQIYPKGSRYFTRVQEHYVQAVYQEILYGETSLQIVVVPSCIYQKGWFFVGYRIYPKYTKMETGTDPNTYTKLEIKTGAQKEKYYKSDEMISVWDNVIESQLKEEIIDYFEQFDFEKYQELCVKGGNDILSYGSSCDAVRFYAAGYNNIWQKKYDTAEIYLGKGISDAEWLFSKRKEAGGPEDAQFNKDLYAAREIMSILKKKETGWEKLLEEKLYFLEKDALEKVWGYNLD